MAKGDKNGGNEPQSPWGRPTGGNGGGSEPPRGSGVPPETPDFEEWVRGAHQQFRTMFGGSGSNMPGQEDGYKGLIAILVVIFLLWLASGIYFVKADEQGVVLRFGEYNRTTASGLNYHLPYPFESVETPRVTAINRVEIGFRSGSRNSKNSMPIGEESLMLTGDENIVDVDFEVQWKISDAPAYLFNVRDPEEAVKAVGESAMREVMGQAHIATVLAEGKLQVEQDAKKLIQHTLDDYKSGIEIVAVNLMRADPPAQVIDSFRDVQTARADLETSRNQAEAYRNDILPKARGAAQQMILEAEGYKQEVIARAQGEASRFSAVYNEFKVAKDITRKRMYLEAMEEIMQGMSKVIVEGRGAQGVVPYLPLPELKARKEETAK